jgi:hypothetical protein
MFSKLGKIIIKGLNRFWNVYNFVNPIDELDLILIIVMNIELNLILRWYFFD